MDTRFLAVVAACALLGACAIFPEREPAPRATVDKPPPLAAEKPMETEEVAAAAVRPAPPAPRPGSGVVESASVVALSATPLSPAAGATGEAPEGPTMGYRVRMADGSTQSVVQAGERFAPGDKVEMTEDGRLIRQ